MPILKNPQIFPIRQQMPSSLPACAGRNAEPTISAANNILRKYYWYYIAHTASPIFQNAPINLAVLTGNVKLCNDEDILQQEK
jgi:hypothetical protein